MSAISHKRTFRPTAISRCDPWFLISILTAKLGAGISGVAPNGHKRRHKEVKIPIESGLGRHLVWVDSITPGRVLAFEEVEAQAKDEWIARLLKTYEVVSTREDFLSGAKHISDSTTMVMLISPTCM